MLELRHTLTVQRQSQHDVVYALNRLLYATVVVF